MLICISFFFFFSSRRRHTRFDCDWSSDVCSSDLAWLAKRGARPVGVDITPVQLETARRMMRETGIEFPLIEADAAETGLPDSSFDLVLSEYGASIWVDPYRWIPEASRLVRPGGRLIFLRN